jgi:hypothetical protein
MGVLKIERKKKYAFCMRVVNIDVKNEHPSEGKNQASHSKLEKKRDSTDACSKMLKKTALPAKGLALLEQGLLTLRNKGF